MAEIADDDWQRTPPRVQECLRDVTQRLAEVEQRLAALEEDNRRLRERLANNSGNSSQPPSADPPGVVVRLGKPATGRKRGGQAGHDGSRRTLVPVEQCQKVVDHSPRYCRGCGGALVGEDPEPYRHQVVEMPPLTPSVEEHRWQQLTCAACGTATRARLPGEVSPSGYGPRVVAIVAVLSGLYRLRERMAQRAMQDVFGVAMALGTVNTLRQEASAAVAAPVEEACASVTQQPVVHGDETGFVQGNADGRNPTQRTAWLWVAVTPWVTVFRVSLSRGQDAARALLGEAFAGLLVSDRWQGYTWVPLYARQLCWAHLKRDCTKIAERGGASGRIGEALLEQERRLFAYWHRVRDGTLQRSSFKTYAGKIRRQVKGLLEDGAASQPKRGEKSARALTARTCREVLTLEPAMWLFVSVEGVEPTNHAAERAIRPAVLWRRTSVGAQSADGSAFVARMLTVVMTVRSQAGNVLDSLTQACRAAREGQPAPSLLPQTSETGCHVLSAA